MNLLQTLPFKSLYTFSVAARHLNFTKAANELHITPSAVSHQIKRLERTLGCKLFEIEGKVLVLSPEASKFALQISQAYSTIENAADNFLHSKKNVIHIGVDSAFAVKRFSQEIGVWQNEFPELDLRLRMTTSKTDLANINLDIVLSRKIVDHKYQSDFICHEKYYPVCSRELYLNLGSLNLNNILKDTPLIDLMGLDCWKNWFEWKNLELEKKQQVLYFSHTLLILEAVLAGRGVALLDKHLIKNELDSGALVLLDKEAYCHSDIDYYFSYLNSRKNDNSIYKLKQWIFSMFN
jgi:DNA-binding transcriptional LysR family regulator